MVAVVAKVKVANRFVRPSCDDRVWLARHREIQRFMSRFIHLTSSAREVAVIPGRQRVLRYHTFKARNHKYNPVHENDQAIPFCCPGGRPLRVRIRDSLLGRARQKCRTERCNFRHSATKPRRQYAAAKDVVQRRRIFFSDQL